MRTSVRWINDYLDRPATAEEQADALTAVGLNFDGRETLPDGAIWQEIETTSNRGDCLCHYGLARELAARTKRSLKPPASHSASKASGAKPATGEPASKIIKVTNEEHEGCPRYTARVIRGVKVGPSPVWLQERLRDAGQIPRNNIVDCTNFVLLELGQPTHVFDLATLAGPEIRVRRARAKEVFLPLGEQMAPIELTPADLVIADAKNAVAMAGVKGGAASAVKESTTDIVLEAATFNPSQVRASSRRHRIASDSSKRFERGVHPASIDAAAERLAALILETAGGTLCAGVVEAGAPLPPPRIVSMRKARCRRILGAEIADEEMTGTLQTLGFAPKAKGDLLECTVPPQRMDIEREVDLIEEVIRLIGLERVPTGESIQIRTAAPDAKMEAGERLRDTLAGMDFVECVTHALISDASANAMLHPPLAALRIEDERAGGTPCLRPSVLPGLLATRKINEDRGAIDSLRLFEIASIFHLNAAKEHRESVSLGMIADAAKEEEGYRSLRGVIERLAHEIAAKPARFAPTASDSVMHPAAEISIDGAVIGRIGFLTPAVRQAFGLEKPLIAAEVALESLLKHWPPERPAAALPSMPSVERDLSLILGNEKTWAEVEGVILRSRPAHLESLSFTGTYKGKQTGADRKSLTLRLVFRDAARTLRREEIDLEVQALVKTLQAELGAELRA
ncbi:MAG: phenylalanine--tRNA ligase subunit beta [Planctomycetes bacterium]|nr:phenylalanine--tRNA ligase subunit beta [Planctomycetota bacterium]